MTKWSDLNPGDTIIRKGKTYFVEMIEDSVYTLRCEDGTLTHGEPRSLSAEVERTGRADPLVSACSRASGATPMECAATAVRLRLGAVVVGERVSGGAWLCPPEMTSDDATLQVHRQMFHDPFLPHDHS